MKIITFAVPCFNSQNYLEKCLDSLICGGNDVEVIIVNDGSTDNTETIAKKYVKKYPKICKLISKENGGHGSAINEGLKHASGIFYKVVDSDDWIDSESLPEFLDMIKIHLSNNEEADLYLSDFIYEHVSDQTQYIRSYQEYFPTNQMFSWADLKKKFRYSASLLMHALTYKTSILKACNLSLPHHTFYVDNIFAYEPLPYVTKLYYNPKVMYHYFIGREDQSININNFSKRYLQQIKVMNLLCDAYKMDYIELQKPGLKQYMKHNLNVMMLITQMFTMAIIEEQRINDLNELWYNIKVSDPKMYKYLRFRSYNVLVNFLPKKLKKFVLIKGYFSLVKKIKLG